MPRLAFFQREHQFLSQSELTSEVTAHYTGQAVKQLYVLVLGLDVIGNPFGLVVGLTDGVSDLFYEPVQVRVWTQLLPFSWGGGCLRCR